MSKIKEFLFSPKTLTFVCIFNGLVYFISGIKYTIDDAYIYAVIYFLLSPFWFYRSFLYWKEYNIFIKKS